MYALRTCRTHDKLSTLEGRIDTFSGLGENQIFWGWKLETLTHPFPLSLAEPALQVIILNSLESSQGRGPPCSHIDTFSYRSSLNSSLVLDKRRSKWINQNDYLIRSSVKRWLCENGHEKIEVKTSLWPILGFPPTGYGMGLGLMSICGDLWNFWAERLCPISQGALLVLIDLLNCNWGWKVMK